MEKTLESPLDFKEIKAVNPERISPEYSLEGLMLKLKLQYFGHLMGRTDLFEKRKDCRWEEKDKVVGWHHGLNGHELE